MTSWQVGAVSVTRLPQMTWRIPLAALVPEAPADLVDISLHGLLVEAGERRILVDTCSGHDEGSEAVLDLVRRGGTITEHHPDVRTALEAAGHAAADVDTVVCTHLHFDHVGGNVTDDGALAFPSARYVFAGEEWEWWRTHPEDGQYPMAQLGVAPVIDAGVADFVDGDHQLTDEVGLVPTPGHAPGHVSVHISSQGDEAVITGDLAHHPLELFEPSWAMVADVDATRASATRRAFADEHGDGSTLVLGTHFGAGRLHAAERRWEPV